ncbi:hypothetical protein QFC24_001330 [Naganishia onofrii]|uniref:Uncharacterized protein n=1 Tax=Naganishia onofrii TaxID=1851511 RepID=A0ACC2XUQ9_9TREE|nr:hypothetical protein QFC24_001330 [Naganishia onofrii]
MNALSTLDRFVSERRRDARSTSSSPSSGSPLRRGSSPANATSAGSPLQREKVTVPVSILAATDPVLGSELGPSSEKGDQSGAVPPARVRPKRRPTGFPIARSSSEIGNGNVGVTSGLPTRTGHDRQQRPHRQRKGQSRRTQPRNRDRNPEEGWMTAGFVGVLGLWSDLWTVIFGPDDEHVGTERVGVKTLGKAGTGKENGKGKHRAEEVSASSASESEDDQHRQNTKKSEEQGMLRKADAGWVDPVTRAPDNPEDLIRQAAEAESLSSALPVSRNGNSVDKEAEIQSNQPPSQHRQAPNVISFSLKKKPGASAISDTSYPASAQSTSSSGSELLPPSSILTNSTRHTRGIQTLVPRLELLSRNSEEEGSSESEKNTTSCNTALISTARSTKLLPVPLSVPLSATAPRFSQRRSDPNPSNRTSHSHHQHTISISSIPGVLSTTPFHRPKTLILDLDETLIHSTSRPMSLQSSGMGSGSGMMGIQLSGLFSGGKHQRGGGGARGEGHVVEVVLGGRSTLYHVYKRPYVDHFLKKVSSWYTLVIFTASMQEYADPVIDWLDGGRGYFAKKLYRESCALQPNGSYTKDLSLVEEDLSRVCFMDNSPVSYNWNKEVIISTIGSYSRHQRIEIPSTCAARLRLTQYLNLEVDTLIDVMMTRDAPSVNTCPLPPSIIVPLPDKSDTSLVDFNGSVSASSEPQQRIRGISYIKDHGLEKDRNREQQEKDDTPTMEEKPQQPMKDYFSEPIATPVESPGLMTPAGTATPMTPATPLQRTASRSPLVYATGSRAVNRRASTSSFSSFRLDGDMDDLSVNDDAAPHNSLGIRQADTVIDASAWRQPSFKSDLLTLLRKLKIPLWSSSHLTSTNVHVQRISGAMTNAVFFCSYNPTDKPLEPTMSPMLTPKIPGARSHLPGERLPPTLLVRVFGPSSGALIERDQELRILHILSSRYGLGPRIEGIFENGRIEQFFPSRALTPGELRDPTTSCHIAKRMRELHSVDLRALGFEEGSKSKPTVWQCLIDWLGHARNVQRQISEIPTLKDWMDEFGPLDLLEKEIQTYIAYVDSNPDRDHGHGSVFSHNDTQYGNLLILDEPLPPSEPPHRKLIVIDFEYASPNPRGFDIANHFHEWQADYHHPTHNHSLTHHEPYPTMDERARFYRSYLSVQMSARDGKEKITSEEQIEQSRVDALEKEVRLWSPASSVFWALWGMVQAEEQIQRTKDVENEEERARLLEAEFDYLKYALGRIRMFRQEAAELGALKDDPKAL